MTGKPGDALSFISGLAHVPTYLSLRGRIGLHGIDFRGEDSVAHGAPAFSPLRTFPPRLSACREVSQLWD
jgi:hypothetical protein